MHMSEEQYLSARINYTEFTSIEGFTLVQEDVTRIRALTDYLLNPQTEPDQFTAEEHLKQDT